MPQPIVQKTLYVLKTYLRDYPISNGSWQYFDKYGVLQQPWSVRDDKQAFVFRTDEGAGRLNAVIVSYYDPGEPGAKKKKAAEEEDEVEKPAVQVLLPYINAVAWYPEGQDATNPYAEETFHFFHPAGSGRFVGGHFQGGIGHWMEKRDELRSSAERLTDVQLERLKEIQDPKVQEAIAEVFTNASPLGKEEFQTGLEAVLKSTAHIRPYWKTLDIYEMPKGFK